MKFANSLFIAIIMICFTACGGGTESTNEMTPEMMIAGTASKTWKAAESYDSTGGESTLSDEEKQETMRFYANGDFSMETTDETANGTWNYRSGEKSLSVTFDGANVREVFRIEALTAESMTLIAEDGSKLVMKPS